MFDHLARIFGRRRQRVPTFGDAVLGTLSLEPDGKWWEAHLTLGGRRVTFAIGGGDEPDSALLAHARHLALDFEAFDARVARFLGEEAAQWAADCDGYYTAEIRALRIESVHLCWPDRPDDGMIFFDGGVEDRVWRCDYRVRQPTGLGFDS